MIIDKDLYEKISGVTCDDYSPTQVFGENKYYIYDDDVISMFEDLVSEIDCLNEKIEDMEEDIKDNYKPISKSEQYGISDRDFI